MSTRSMILFPYSGYRAGDSREATFDELVARCREYLSGTRPLVVVNRDTETRGGAAAFLARYQSEAEVEILKVWSVDTCQMWLAGWGHILSEDADATRIVQLPGDLDVIADNRDFFNRLRNFVKTPVDPIAVGDFKTGEKFSAKDLIDLYGTLPLLANWFPELSEAMLELPLSKPRSEFLNFDRATLERLLAHRKFAYEQTLNILIRAWSFDKHTWEHEIGVHDLGEIHDDRSLRKYRDCIDQIERTERMLRLIWRELNEPEQVQDKHEYAAFIDQYVLRDQRSTAIRDTAIVTIRNLIGGADDPTPIRRHATDRYVSA
jgi:hypothetical protein